MSREVRADFSRTCEDCGDVVEEKAVRGKLLARCVAPGPCRGYTVSSGGRFLPHVPAWCPREKPQEDSP